MDALLEPPDPVTLLAGRRLVRRLGTGRRWSAYSTVVASSAPQHVGRPRQQGQSGEAILLRARADAAERGLWRRAAILSRLDHPHILRLLDVAEDVGGAPCLLVERLSGGTLAELLRRRGTIAPGEAVTILAPLVDALRAAHFAGVAHRGVSATSVAFDGDGRPVLIGWCDAQADGDAESGGERSAAFSDDWIALGGLVDGVLAATTAGETSAERSSAEQVQSVSEWMHELAAAVADHEVANRLQQRIHQLARPLPVLLDAAEAQAPASVSDAVRAQAGLLDRGDRRSTRRDVVAERRRNARRLPRFLGRIGALRRPSDAGGPGGSGSREPGSREPGSGDPGSGDPGSGATRGRSSGARAPRRRRLVIGSAAAAMGLALLAVVCIPVSPEDDRQAQAVVPPTSTSTDQAAPPTQRQPSTDPPATAAPLPDGTALDEQETEGDDPVLATAALVERRSRCLGTASSASCLGDYAEAGSPFADAEVTGEAPGAVDAATIELVDRQGDAAVLRATALRTSGGTAAHAERQPVTLLVVRGETGWRLREVFSAA